MKYFIKHILATFILLIIFDVSDIDLHKFPFWKAVIFWPSIFTYVEYIRYIRKK